MQKSKPEAKEVKRNSPKETEHTAQSKRVKMRKGRGLGKESRRGKTAGGGKHRIFVGFSFSLPRRLSLCISPHITNKLTEIIKHQVEVVCEQPLDRLVKIVIKNIVFILTVTIILSCCGGNNIATTIHTGSYVEVSRDDNGINLDFSNTLLEAIF